MGRSKDRSPPGQKHRTSSPENKNKYLGERSCTKDLELFYCLNFCVKESGNSSKKFASYPFAEINYVKVPNGVAFLHPSSPFVGEGGSWSFMNAVDPLNEEMSNSFKGLFTPF